MIMESVKKIKNIMFFIQVINFLKKIDYKHNQIILDLEKDLIEN